MHTYKSTPGDPGGLQRRTRPLPHRDRPRRGAWGEKSTDDTPKRTYTYINNKPNTTKQEPAFLLLGRRLLTSEQRPPSPTQPEPSPFAKKSPREQLQLLTPPPPARSALSSSGQRRAGRGSWPYAEDGEMTPEGLADLLRKRGHLVDEDEVCVCGGKGRIQLPARGGIYACTDPPFLHP